MSKEEILSCIRTLAASQGFYGRLYEQIHDNTAALDYLEQQHFKDVLDLVLFLET